MNTKVFFRQIIFSAICFPVLLFADQKLDLELRDGDIKPDITIQSYDNRTSEEYRVNGNLYMIKVKPSAGPAYYIVDPDGDGDFERRRGSGGIDVRPPQWVLLSW